MTNVRDEHDAVARSDAEQRNEPDDRRNGQNTAREIHPDDTADQRERQIEHHEHGVTSRAERRHQHEENSDDDTERYPQQLPRRLRFALELAAVLDVITLRKP